jgi:hypothetical protein
MRTLPKLTLAFFGRHQLSPKKAHGFRAEQRSDDTYMPLLGFPSPKWCFVV